MTLRTRLFSLLFVIAAVLTVVVTMHLLEFYNLKDDSTAMNLAGSMRYRANRVVILVHDYLDTESVDEKTAIRREIDGEVALVEQIVEGLRHGDLELGLHQASTTSASFLRQLDSVEVGWQNYKAKVYQEIALRHANASITDLRHQCDALVTEIHKAVGLLEQAQKEKLLSDLKLDGVSLGIVVAAFAGLIVFTRKRILAPLREVDHFAVRLGGGDLDARIAFPGLLTGRDEIGALARALNDMAAKLKDLYYTLDRKVQERTQELTATNEELIASQEELRENYVQLEQAMQQLKVAQEALIRMEKSSSMGTLAAGVAHEINNPLSGIIGYAEGLIRDIEAGRFNNEKALKALQRICDSGWRCARIVSALKSYARQGDVVMGSENINDLLEDALHLTSAQLREKNIEVIKELNETLSAKPVVCDGGKMRQVIVSLLMNAMEAVPPHSGRITLRSNAVNGGAVVEIEDNGCGMSKDILPKIFDPFYTTKEVGHGMGLGLAMCKGYIDSHQGNIAVSSDEGNGTRFTITIPFQQSGSSSASSHNGDEASMGRYDDSTGPTGYRGI
ncbi:MAG: ATP-binding protein [Nitrospirota bacterium]|nr:ATP-binding protein [Nitrospirota bacterium]